jgi:predicted transglutaminase-like cysteine proteinase
MAAFKKVQRAGLAVVGALALLLAGVSAGSAGAKVKAKKATLVAVAAAPAGAASSPPLKLNSPLALARSTEAAAPARFFTINQVLAKLDSQQGAGSDGRPALNGARSESEIGAFLPAPAGLSIETDEPFGLFTFRAPEGALWIKWRRLEAEIAIDRETLQHCQAIPTQCASPAARRFSQVIGDIRKHEGGARIDAANRMINASIRYVSDVAQHGAPDLWSAPLSTFANQQGDCEDYAIAKYVALREAGVGSDDLRLLLVRDRRAGDHAVLGVRLDGRWLILDNRHAALLEPDGVRHFRPMFALDHRGVKLFAAPYATSLPALTDPAPAVSQHVHPSPASTGSALRSLPLLL